MKKIIIVLCFLILSCGSTKQCKSKKQYNNQDQQRVEQGIMGGLLFSLVTYVFISALQHN